MKTLNSKKNSKKQYNPNLGFIGNVEVKVANYLFSAKKLRKAYQHAEPLAKRILVRAFPWSSGCIGGVGGEGGASFSGGAQGAGSQMC